MGKSAVVWSPRGNSTSIHLGRGKDSGVSMGAPDMEPQGTRCQKWKPSSKQRRNDKEGRERRKSPMAAFYQGLFLPL